MFVREEKTKNVMTVIHSIINPILLHSSFVYV